MDRCACLIGNSSVGLREGAWLGMPTVNIGSRQRMRERGANVVDADHDAGSILAAIKAQVAHGKYPKETRFGEGDAGVRIRFND